MKGDEGCFLAMWVWGNTQKKYGVKEIINKIKYKPQLKSRI